MVMDADVPNRQGIEKIWGKNFNSQQLRMYLLSVCQNASYAAELKTLLARTRVASMHRGDRKDANHWQAMQGVCDSRMA